MAVGLVAPYLSDKLGIPVVASMTLAGILLGPELIGFLEPGILLQLLGSLGLIFVFFNAGAETSLGIIKKRPFSVLLFGALTFFIPFAAGFIFGYFLFGKNLSSALIVGAFFASSGSRSIQPLLPADLSSRESAEIGIAGSGLSRIAVTLILFFSLFVQAQSIALPSLATFGIWLLYFIVLGITLPRFAPFVLRNMRAQGGIDAMFLLFLLFASAALASLIGLPSYLGALYAGLLLASTLGASRTISARVNLLGESFFLPFLFVFIGAQANFSQTPSLPRVLLFIAGSVLLGLGSKTLAAYLTGKALRLSTEDRGLLFGFSSCFSAFSLATASVAGSTGHFDQPLLGGAVILVILSTSLTALVARTAGYRLRRKNSESQGKPFFEGSRILIPLSKPTSSHHLIELGELLQEQSLGSPLLPLVVMPEQNSEERRKAETMLAAALMRGLDPQTPVSPLFRVETNVAYAILQSAEEQGADTILVGWNKPPRLANAFFGSVIDQILNSCDQRVLVARLVAPLQSSHIAAVLPPFCETHEGFNAALAVLKALTKKYQSKLHIVTLKGQNASITRALREANFGISYQSMEIEAWKDIGKTLESIPGQSRFFVLFSARPSEASWHPAVERLPHRIGEEFPQSNLLIIYMARGEQAAYLNRSALPSVYSGAPGASGSSSAPGASGSSGAPGAPGSSGAPASSGAFAASAGPSSSGVSGTSDSPAAQGLPASTVSAPQKNAIPEPSPIPNGDITAPSRSRQILEHAVAQGTIRVNMKHSALADGIFELVSSAFPFDRRLSSRLSLALTEQVQRQPIEIAQGVVLMHERLENIRTPILCMGSQREGFRVSLLEKPVRILILILVPEDEKPEEHLSLLGDIASLFRKQNLAAILLEAEKAEDLLV
jgi:Kef-type K+ transport system membrane component KefB/nucleotide-binding universal stress UspA family protein